MTKKNWMMILLVAALFTIYAIYFTDWFKPQTITIYSTYRNLRPWLARGGVQPALIFGLNHQTPLTELRVVPYDAYQTNKDVLPLWHLTSESNSVPLKTFYYGQNLRGLHSAIKGTRPEMLDTNVPYLLIVHHGKVIGEHKFVLK